MAATTPVRSSKKTRQPQISTLNQNKTPSLHVKTPSIFQQATTPAPSNPATANTTPRIATELSSNIIFSAFRNFNSENQTVRNTRFFKLQPSSPSSSTTSYVSSDFPTTPQSQHGFFRPIKDQADLDRSNLICDLLSPKVNSLNISSQNANVRIDSSDSEVYEDDSEDEPGSSQKTVSVSTSTTPKPFRDSPLVRSSNGLATRTPNTFSGHSFNGDPKAFRRPATSVPLDKLSQFPRPVMGTAPPPLPQVFLKRKSVSNELNNRFTYSMDQNNNLVYQPKCLFGGKSSSKASGEVTRARLTSDSRDNHRAGIHRGNCYDTPEVQFAPKRSSEEDPARSCFPDICSRKKNIFQETPRIIGCPRTPNYVNHRDRADNRGKLSIPVMSGKTATRSHTFHGEGKIHYDLLANIILRTPPYDNLNFMLFDCRFPYEYKAGHIKGAENIYLQSDMKDRLFGNKVKLQSGPTEKQPASTGLGSIGPSGNQLSDAKHTILIFHCEFSSERAPRMANIVRDFDRKFNEYPLLHYPELIILEGGYSTFYKALAHSKDQHQLFEKCGYVMQMDRAFKSEESQCLTQIQREKTKARQSASMRSRSKIIATKIPENPVEEARSFSQPPPAHRTPEGRKPRRVTISNKKSRFLRIRAPVETKLANRDSGPPPEPKKRKRTTSIRERNPFEKEPSDKSPNYDSNQDAEPPQPPAKKLNDSIEKPSTVTARQLRSRGRSFYGPPKADTDTAEVPKVQVMNVKKSSDSGVMPTPRDIILGEGDQRVLRSGRKVVFESDSPPTSRSDSKSGESDETLSGTSSETSTPQKQSFLVTSKSTSKKKMAEINTARYSRLRKKLEF